VALARSEWSGIVFEGFYAPRRLVIRERTPVIVGTALTVALWSLLFVAGVRFAFLPGLPVAGPAFGAGFWVGFKQGRRIHQRSVTSGTVVPWWRRRLGPNGQNIWIGLVTAIFVICLPIFSTLDRWIGPDASLPWLVGVQTVIVIFPLGRLIGLLSYEKRVGVMLWYQVGIEATDKPNGRRKTTPLYFTRPATEPAPS